MRKSSRLGAVLLAVAVIASACGGSSEVESDQAALLEELEAQVEELTAEAEAAEQAAAEPIPEPSTTTTEPVVEQEAPVEEVLEPEPVEEEPEEEVAAEPATEAADDTPPAAVSGEVINSSMGPDEVAALIVSMIGPTDNLSGQVSRLDLDFPTISTLPDTEIVQVRLFNTVDPNRGDWEKNTSVEFITSADPADATLAYQTEFAALFPGEDVRTETQQSGDTVFNTARIGGIRITSQAIEQGTFVEVDFWGQPASDAVVESLSRLEQFAAGSNAGEYRSVTAQFSFGSPDISLQTQFVGAAADDIEARADAIAVASGFTFAQVDLGTREYTIDGLAGFAKIRGSESTTTIDGQARGLIWTDYRY